MNHLFIHTQTLFPHTGHLFPYMQTPVITASQRVTMGLHIRNTPPEDTGDLTHSVLAIRTPHTMEFFEEERGKTVYIAIQWQNEKGEKGPWSEIESVIIP